MMTCSIPAATASSTAYWMIGLSTSGSISFGCALVAGRKRVPHPAAGKTALRTRIEPRGDGWGGAGSIPRGAGATRQRAGSSDRSKRRMASLNAAGRSRFERCVAPARRTRRAPCGGPRERPREEAERQVERAIDDQGRAVVRLEQRQEPVAGDRPQRARAAERPEAALDDRLGDRRREAPPEEPPVDDIEPGAVDRCPSPSPGRGTAASSGRSARRSPRPGRARGRAPASGPRAPWRHSRRARARPRSPAGRSRRHRSRLPGGRPRRRA